MTSGLIRKAVLALALVAAVGLAGCVTEEHWHHGAGAAASPPPPPPPPGS